ncbi:hypothetical protein NIES4075_61580 [Tolypothrix sp. NIES-4075]|uniref:DUF6745 domain-containing protein n=1 Tax=Tolypothrix sp. NIES-4075 TaxID=2005459 RepID=UPI000B5CB4D3|nr:hypothetical protein [Tolypothrix sp. NIES-4075]GAX45137.1 hypothetical protein NIES4075_61580 [Tolypothrix sp. NIES-4075]
MSQKKITKLTPEQEALIPVYRDKWRKIALSTERIDREKATEAVKEAYVVSGFNEPKIFFCDSPYAAFKNSFTQLDNPVHKYLRQHLNVPLFRSSINMNLLNKLIIELQNELSKKIWNQVYFQLCNQLEEQLNSLIESRKFNNLQYIEPELWACEASLLDFCVSVLNYTFCQNECLIFQLLITNCGWIFPFENICIVCDRPSLLSFDNQNRLHAEGKPAIQFTDGYSLYAYHGVTLPEKYGKLHPHEWEAKWLLEEDNAELRRVLIQGIGYTRIIEELQATELDFYQEYTLLKIDNNIDIEPIYLLKMTCPSTEFIHVLRVPPDVKSAREAIRWVNWGIDPDEFAVQT